jgi:hydrogenase-4 membrane subunit HyfE
VFFMFTVSLSNTLDSAISILTVGMVLVALGIGSVASIQRMIWLYRLQSLILALLTILVALGSSSTDPFTRVVLLAFAVLIPGMLAYIIGPLLAQATVPAEIPWAERLWRPFRRAFSRGQQEAVQVSIAEAMPVWLEHGLSSYRQIISVTFGLILVLSAYAVAINLVPGDATRALSLGAALALLLLGIFSMINRQDLISQIMGLLVMDHGLFLAAVRVVTRPSLIPILVISLFLYILITLVILVILLPELHAESASIEVGRQTELRG